MSDEDDLTTLRMRIEGFVQAVGFREVQFLRGLRGNAHAAERPGVLGPVVADIQAAVPAQRRKPAFYFDRALPVDAGVRLPRSERRLRRPAWRRRGGESQPAVGTSSSTEQGALKAKTRLFSRALGYLDPGLAAVTSATGAGPFWVGMTVLIRPLASKVNSSMHTERRKAFPFESSLV